MLIQKRPSVGELIELAEYGNTAEVEDKLQTLSHPERVVISAILDKYLSVEATISKVAIFHAASRYLAGEIELNEAEAPIDQVLTNAEQIREDIKVIENAIVSPEKVVVRNDRSGDLGQASSVLQGIAVAKAYGYSGRNTTMAIGGSRKSMPLRPLLSGVRSADQVRNGNNARWAINQNAVEARFEQWCHDVGKEASLAPELENMVKKRKIMRIFNTYIDIIAETDSTFLQNNESLQGIISNNRETIIAELIPQLEKHATSYADETSPSGRKTEETVIVKKYIAAFEELRYEPTDKMICRIIADETSDEAVATSRLYEAA